MKYPAITPHWKEIFDRINEGHIELKIDGHLVMYKSFYTQNVRAWSTHIDKHPCHIDCFALDDPRNRFLKPVLYIPTAGIIELARVRALMDGEAFDEQRYIASNTRALAYCGWWTDAAEIGRHLESLEMPIILNSYKLLA